MTINGISNQHNTSFGSCAVLGNAAKKYFTERAAKESSEAVGEFMKFCDGLTKWGYVTLEQSPKADELILKGSSDLYTSKMSLNSPLSELRAKLGFLKENKGIIDQVD